MIKSLILQAEQLSYTQLLDYLVILVMAAIWFIMPSDGIAVVTQWFYNKVMDVSNIYRRSKCIKMLSYTELHIEGLTLMAGSSCAFHES